MVHKRFILRQIRRSGKQTTIFVLCVAISIVTISSLGSFGESVRASMLKDARKLHAADIIIRSHYALSDGIEALLRSLQEKGAIESARVYLFYSVVRSADDRQSLLAGVKVTDPGYPFYGEVRLASGRPFHEVLTPGGAIVEQPLLDRMGLAVGSTLRVGDAALAIRDVVVDEPDRPMNFFSLGPRVFVSSADLGALGLVTEGSRVDHLALVKVTREEDLDRIAARLSAAAKAPQERVDTYKTAGSRAKRFLDNLLFFLNMVGVFTLLLGGVGIQSAVTAFLKGEEKTIGTMKALGATNRFILTQFIILLTALGAVGTLIGLAGGFVLQTFLPALLHGMLPSADAPELALTLRAVARGLLLGFLVVVLFTALPLYRLRELKPNTILRGEEPEGGGGRGAVIFWALAALGFTAMTLWQVRDAALGARFVGGVLLLALVISVLTGGMLAALKRRPLPTLQGRQAVKGLFRPRNSTMAIAATLAASLAVIFTITLVERNLDATFVRSYPEDAPNMFFLDVQPSQREAFEEALGAPAEYYPIVRARITAINGKPIDVEKELERRGDNLAREFNLTYRDHLLPGESLARGSGLFASGADNDKVSVSLLDVFADDNGIRMGDAIDFNIQGVPLAARVSSIRTQPKRLMQPFFYFVLPERVLKDAPQTTFAALRVDASQISPLQSRMVSLFPNVSVIDATQIAETMERIMRRFSDVARFFAFFSFGAGILIIVGSVLATRAARMRQAVYYKVLGARSAFVMQVFALENIALGLCGAIPALAVAQAATFAIARMALDIPYTPCWGASFFMVAAAICAIAGVGLVASIPVLRQRPIVFLREETEE